LYHSFGPSKNKPVDKTSRIYLALGDEGMVTYKTIFDNNNKSQVTKFFLDDIIRKLWDQTVFPNLTFDKCIEKTSKPNSEIELTYREITRIME
jgi:hypothetical protein